MRVLRIRVEVGNAWEDRRRYYEYSKSFAFDADQGSESIDQFKGKLDVLMHDLMWTLEGDMLEVMGVDDDAGVRG